MPSLRNHLWLSYAALIGVLSLTVAVTLLWSLLRSPLLYRSTTQQLRLISALTARRLQSQPDLQSDKISRQLDLAAQESALRLAIINPSGQVTYDSGAGQYPALRLTDLTLSPVIQMDVPVRTFRVPQSRVWFYVLQPLPGDYILVTTTPRPQQTLRGILRDEMLGPLFFSGSLALLLAFIFSAFMSRWIARPLQQLAEGARSMAKGQYPILTPSGPREIFDLTQSLNDLSQQVQTSQQAQRDLIGNISHELKTPITAIQGFSQAILDGTVASPAALQEAATVMSVESDRMHRLVSDLLTLTRLEGGIADLHRAPVDLNALLHHAQARFSLQARRSGVELVVLSGSVPPIIGDGDRLSQVLANLVDNALKYTPPGGKITLSAAAEGDWAILRITDTGPGIPADEQERIFERFYQLDKSRRGGSGRGVGLGLPIAREIIRAHSGSLWVESSPGQGSVFVIKIPFVLPDDITLNQKANNA